MKNHNVISALAIIISIIAIGINVHNYQSKAEAYNATLNAPIVVPDVSNKMLDYILFEVDANPGQWSTMTGEEKLAAVSVKCRIKHWREVDGEWQVFAHEMSNTTAGVFFGGSMDGEAANFDARIKELLIAGGVISADDTWN